MSPIDYKEKRPNKNEARKQIGKIMREYPENLRFSGHAVRELAKDDLTTADALNVLRW